MKKVKIEVKSLIEKEQFRLIVAFSPGSGIRQTISFSNAAKRFERNAVVVRNEAGDRLEPVGHTFIAVRNENMSEVVISKSKPFIYEILGRIIDKGPKVLLDLDTASYLLNKNEIYYFSVSIGVSNSNSLEIRF